MCGDVIFCILAAFDKKYIQTDVFSHLCFDYTEVQKARFKQIHTQTPRQNIVTCGSENQVCWLGLE